MVEIRNQRDLKRWLKGRSREEAVAIAARAALRSTPLLGRIKDFKNFGKDALLKSWRAIEAAVSYTGAPADLARVAAAEAADIAAADDNTAAYSAGYAAYTVYAAAAVAAAAAAVSAAAADTNADDIWWGVSRDASALEAGLAPQALLKLPLWPQGVPDWSSQAWNELKAYLDQFPEEHWEVWTDWYEARRDSLPIDWDLQRDRVMIPFQENIWEQGYVVINYRLKEIISVHQARALEQDPLGQPFAEQDLQIDLDLAGKGVIADGAEIREDHVSARESLKELVVLTSESNRLMQLAQRADKALEALGGSVAEIQANALARALTQLKISLEADERRRVEKDPDQPPLEAGEWMALRIAVADLNALTSADSYLAAQRAKYEEKSPNAPPPDKVEEMARSAEAAKIATSRAAEAVVEAGVSRSEGGNLTTGNFLRRAVKTVKYTAAVVAVGAAVGAGSVALGGWMVANEKTLIPIAEKVAPDLAPIMQKTIDFLKTMPVKPPS